MKSVAIIGAGVSGLCTLKQALRSNIIKPIVYEMAPGIGGTWVYSDNPNITDFGSQDVGVTSAIYESLVSNQPKQIMELSDMKHDDATPTYLKHEEVLKYLKQFCTEFKLEDHIRFWHKVEGITPVPRLAGDRDFKNLRWKINVRNLRNNELKSSTFDAVVVCNGHYVKPNLPGIPGEENFTGRILHSQMYRKSCQFACKDVLIIGAGASGVDIAIDVSSRARNVYVSHRKRSSNGEMPTNLTEVPEVSHFNEDGHCVTFVNGETKQIDAVIYCTGYLYSFPFLDEKCGITITDNRVQPLFQHIVNIDYNNMLFVGLPGKIPVFKILDLQAIFAVAVLEGKVTLPTRNDMFAYEASDYNGRLKNCERHAHVMSNRVFEYADYLCDVAGIDRIPNNLKNLYNFILDHRSKNPCGYKKEKYDLNDSNEFEIDNAT